MTRRRSPWSVARDRSQLRYAFFISHVAEDADEVRQLQAAILSVSRRGRSEPLTSFLDVEDWPLGNPNNGVIRDCLLKSAHLVLWVTPAYLRSTRGWVWIELAYGDLIERSMNPDLLDLKHAFIIPIYRQVTVAEIDRTPLLEYWQRKLVLPDEERSVRDLAQLLVTFHDQEALKWDAAS